MKRYRHIFFDLDHTIWDFQANSRATLEELHGEQQLDALGIPDAASFIEVYEEVNQVLWGRYEAGRIPKEVLRVLRFRNTLLHFGLKDERLAVYLGHAYLDRCPRRPQLMPGAKELLDDLLSADHRLHVITNGFDEVQRLKLESSGIAPCFEVVLSSERAQARKPDPRIFHKAMSLANASVVESLMVGDNTEADMAGARGAGMDHAHFAADAVPDPLATYRIRSMHELRAILL